MARFMFGAALAALGLAIAQPAKANKADMLAAVAGKCVASGSVAADGRPIGEISAKNLWKAIAKGFPIPIGDALSDGQTLSARLLAEKITLVKPSEEAAQLVHIRDAVKSWTGLTDEAGAAAAELPADGGVRVMARDGHRLQYRDLPGVLTDLISGDDANFVFRCTPPASAKPQGEDTSGSSVAFVIAKAPADLLSPLKAKSFGEFSFIDDRQKRAQSYGIEAAMGWQFKLADVVRESGTGDARRQTTLTRNLLPYVQIVRKGTNDPKDAAKPQDEKDYLNSLTFGGQFGGRLVLRGRDTYVHYFAASAAYQTDDDFDSEVHLFEARLDPDFPGHLPGHRAFYDLLASRDDTVARAPNAPVLEARWTTAAVFDLVDVEDPGNFKKLAERKEFSRLGYDLKLDFLFGLADQPWRLKWANEYKLRDGQTRDGGDAQLFSSKLLILPRDDSRLSFGLGYTRGEDLGTLEQSEIWNLVVGIRR